MEIINFRSRLTIEHPTAGRAIVTTFWEIQRTSLTPIVEICRQITAKLVGPGLYSDAWCALLNNTVFLERFQIGPVGHGFYVDQKLGGNSFKGFRPAIFFPGFQQPEINARVSFVAGFHRLQWTQIPFVWQNDFVQDVIWPDTRDWIWFNVELWLRDYFTAAGDLFYLVVRSHQLLYVRPITYRVEERPSRQLHRRRHV